MSSSGNYPLFAELNLFKMNIKSILKIFSVLNNIGRIWANSNINLAVQIGMDVQQFAYVEMRIISSSSSHLYWRNLQPSQLSQALAGTKRHLEVFFHTHVY